MIRINETPLVVTIKERCRVCYTCVRECPAKAIRIVEGQAEVITERCIGCGNCVRVCSQHAKRVLSSSEKVFEMLAGADPVAACLAPSFPAEFDKLDHTELIGMLRGLGFKYVHEVAFGADLVAGAYRKLLEDFPDSRFISANCPGVVGYIERYSPRLVESLAPLVSPMVALARFLRRYYEGRIRVVFIGPCIAKKGEAESCNLAGDVDAALTFVELQQMFDARGITPGKVERRDFDPPYAGEGALFPISRGLLQAAEIDENLITDDIVVADGRTGFVEAIKDYEEGNMQARLLEVLCCTGCIMGPGMRSTLPMFSRRSRVSRYVRWRIAHPEPEMQPRMLECIKDLDLSRRFTADDQRIPVPSGNEIKEILARIGKFCPQDELNCGACGYETCIEHAVAIYKGLAESEMCLPYTIEQLRRTVGELAVSNDNLATAKEALQQSEKLATMGQLAAGIAHEINNPLGVVLMYSHLLMDECQSNSNLREDLQMIVEQADRCKKIVAGLLHFARRNKVVLQPTDVSELVDDCLRSVRVPAEVEVKLDNRLGDNPVADLDRDQMIQALTNLVSNAITAMVGGGTLSLTITGDADRVRISVSDTGVGIPRDNIAKIFEPFFTTKKLGVGTGLGLAVTYGIVKMHRGDISLISNADPGVGPTGTTFTITLPREGRPD
jgi:signal transduction histidine kinase/iron only hydrogenase large subunit-like protein